MSKTLESLLAELHQKQSVLNGWAAVLSLSEKATIDMVEVHWPKPGTRGEAKRAHEGDSGADVARIELELGPRQLGLDPDSCRLTFTWEASGPSGLEGSARLEGSAPLRLETDSRNELCRVLILDLGALELRSHGGGTRAAKLGDRLAGALKAGGGLRLATFSLAPEQRLRRLQPTTLQLNSMTTASGEKVLQMLVGTGREPDHSSVDLSEPVPTASGADFSLVVDSSIVIRDLVTDFNAEPGLLKLAAIGPAAGEKNGAWYAQTRNPLSFSSSVSWGKAIPKIEGQAVMGMNLKGSTGVGFVLSSYLDPASSLDLQLTVQGEFPLQIESVDGEQKVGLTSGQTTLEATGVAENSVLPQLTSFIDTDLRPNLAKLTFSQATTLLLETLQLPLHLPQVDHARMPAELLLAGRLTRKSERP